MQNSSSGTAAAAVAVKLDHVSKRYGDVLALNDISMELSAGQIHAFVGQNGAGKSTCLGTIAGRISPSLGSITVLGTRYPQTVDATFAKQASVASIYQELSIFAELSALENAFMGQLGPARKLVDWKKLRIRFRELCELLNVAIDPDSRAGALSLADQQMLEIMRGLALNSRVLLLDEPTAALAPSEREALFSVMRGLRDNGVCLIFVSHYLDEVLANADSISVFRDGGLVQQAPVTAWDEDALVRNMLGSEAGALIESARERAKRAPLSPAADSAPLLELRQVSSGRLESISLTVNRGEIVGIGGLVGSGRSTLLRTIGGSQAAAGGEMVLDGRRMAMPRSPRQAWKRRIGHIPEDRKRDGLVLEMTGRENIMIGAPRTVSNAGLVSTKLLRQRSDALAEDYGLPLRMLDQKSGELSGGNQQKLLFARSGLRQPVILLADEATRGIDIAAKGQILASLRELADAGLGVIFVSSDLEEVAAISDRVYVLRAGRIVAELQNNPQLSQNEILKPAFGLEA